MWILITTCPSILQESERLPAKYWLAWRSSSSSPMSYNALMSARPKTCHCPGWIPMKLVSPVDRSIKSSVFDQEYRNTKLVLAQSENSTDCSWINLCNAFEQCFFPELVLTLEGIQRV
ncbi:hypothetical protein RvY_16946-3 [Ramazzottius varieornatus]|uniref:Uncharacterized protein n=1 Tax=Ramazzottius varieornatus TaxID=947166 RepID=A0A1D1W2U4_RAMVA|nr:hypothetical protein RvY_16946-3 [Ramazzottius varieornatus]